MEEMKNEQAQAAEKINFADVDVEQLRDELKKAIEEQEKYKRWWLDASNEEDRLRDDIRELNEKLRKVAAVAELYCKEYGKESSKSSFA